MNFAQLDEFAGNVSKVIFDCGSSLSRWIMDTGATNHICEVKDKFVCLKPLTKPILIHLRDGTTKPVKFCGDIHLHRTFCLKNVLYIPSFKHNLLSVSRLTKINYIKLTFYPTHCELQDQRTSEIVAVGSADNHLYFLNDKSFLINAHASCNLSSVFKNSDDFSVWHQRLGHASELVLKHLPFPLNKTISNSNTCDVCQFSKQTILPF